MKAKVLKYKLAKAIYNGRIWFEEKNGERILLQIVTVLTTLFAIDIILLIVGLICRLKA